MRENRDWNRMIDDVDREIREEREAAAKAQPQLPPPLMFDMGPCFNSAAMERAIQSHEDRITYLDRRDRGRA
jgi:hypothetical protein